jgi:hypothetical protein
MRYIRSRRTRHHTDDHQRERTSPASRAQRLSWFPVAQDESRRPATDEGVTMPEPDPSSPLISMPKGGGALQAIGETFSPDLHTGTGNFTVPIPLPPGRNGLQPKISLVYSTGNGNGPFGLGWSLSIPIIQRKTSKGLPQYPHLVDRRSFPAFLLRRRGRNQPGMDDPPYRRIRQGDYQGRRLPSAGVKGWQARLLPERGLRPSGSLVGHGGWHR